VVRAAIYCRISDDREGRELGVQRQETDCRARARRERVRVAEVFVENDRGASRHSRKPRPEYQRMLDAIKAGEIGVVIAYSNSRLTRRPRELEDLLDLHDQVGVRYLTVVSGDDDLATADGRMVARMKVTIDAGEADRISERVRREATEQAESGKNPGGIRPYGWSAENRSVLVPAEHAVIVELADRILLGESLRSLVADLNQRGVPTVTGTPWTSTVIRSMMLRPRLAGWRTHHSEIVAKGKWQPALDDDVWRQVRAVLTDPERRSGGAGARVNLLTGLARCGVCDQPVTIQYGGRKRSPDSRRAYGCRQCGIWRAQPAVDRYINGVMAVFLEHAIENADTDEDVRTDPAVAAKVKTLQKRIEAEHQAYADDDTVTPSEYRRNIRRLKARLEAEERKLLPPRRSRLIDQFTGADPAQMWAAMPLDRKRSCIADLIEIRILPAGPGRRVFRPETVEVTRKP